ERTRSPQRNCDEQAPGRTPQVNPFSHQAPLTLRINLKLRQTTHLRVPRQAAAGGAHPPPRRSETPRSPTHVVRRLGWMPPRIDGETASPLGRSVDDDLEEAAGARLDAAFHAIDLLEHACGDGVFGGSGSVEDTAMEDDDGVGPAGGEVEVVEDDDDDPAFRGEAAYDAHDADLVVQVERAGRLVEEEETGFANDRLGEAEIGRASCRERV